MQARIGERIIPFLTTLACIGWFAGATAPAQAEIVRVIGASLRVHNPDGPQVVTVQATFLGDSSSLFTSELYLDAPTFLGPIFNNHVTPPDTTAALGTFLPETVLYIRNRSYFLSNPSDPSSPASYNFNFFTGDGTLPPNPDRLPHAVFSFDANEPNGPVTVSFEDIFGGGDLDFNDAVYSFTNVRAALVDVAVTPIVNVGQSTAFARFDDYYRNDGTIGNSGLIINYGSGDNSGQLSNLGSLLNDIPGTLLNSDSGRIDNRGDFGSFGSLFNQGEIRNSGALNNAGFLENAGSLTNESGGTVRNLFTGVIENIGSIENSGIFQNVGSLLNQNTGSIANSLGGLLENSGTFVNLGSVLNSVGGVIQNSGAIDNQGEIRILGTLLNEFNGIFSNAMNAIANIAGNLRNAVGATVDNRGSITNAGTLENRGNIFNQIGASLNNSIAGTIKNLLGGTIVNSGSMLNSADAYIENSGVIDNEGTIKNLGTLLNMANATIINVSGAIENLGNLLISAQSSVSGSGTYSQSSGSTVVDGVLGASTIDILGGVLSGSGVVQGEVRIGPDGTLAPGNSPGTLEILGDFHLDGGRIAIELAALGLHDVLDISGAAVFNGGFIDYLFSFTPAAGDSFVFLTAFGGVEGFETLSFNFFGDLGGLRFATLQVDNSLVLKVEPGAVQVPVPGVIWLMAPALLILAIDARRRGRRAGR